MAQVLTGTWEEIKTHDAELVGRQLKVVVDDGERIASVDDTSARLAAFDSWLATPRAAGRVVLDDSRASIYGEYEDHG